MIMRIVQRAALLAMFPALGLACACGCGVFDVGTSSMYASHAGGMAFVEYDYLDQSHNWSGTASAPAADNTDKAIHSTFYTLGGHYMFNRKWGLAVEVPYWQRYMQSADEDTGELMSASHGAVGDIRLRGIYTGLSADMSTGLTFGLKLANGDATYPGFDADMQIGSGSTDLLLGGYHLARLTQDNRWTLFTQAQWDQPVSHRSNYRPGAEVVATAGVYYEGWSLGAGAKFSPVTQLRYVHRLRDGGPDGDAENTGYDRLLVAPGMELAAGKYRIYADVGLPLYTYAHGNQLFANAMWKLNASRNF